MSESQIKNLNLVHKAMVDLHNESGIETESITPEMVKAKIEVTNKTHPMSVELIASYMNWLESSLSVEHMLEVNDSRLNDPSLVVPAVDKEIRICDLDTETRDLFGRLFRQMKDKDWLIFLKDRGYLGEKMKVMPAEEFVRTQIYRQIFGELTGKDAMKKMNKTVYNRTIKVNGILDSISNDTRMERLYEFDMFFKEQAKRLINTYLD